MCHCLSLASLASLTSLKGKLYGKEKFDTVYDFIVDYSHYLLSEMMIYNFLNSQGFNSFKNVLTKSPAVKLFLFSYCLYDYGIAKVN